MAAVASSVGPIRVAVVNALKLIARAGGRVYFIKAEPGALLPYYVVTSFTEAKASFDRYQQRGQGQTALINCWAAEGPEAQRLYEDLVLALDGQLLTLSTGHRLTACTVERVRDLDEPDPLKKSVAVVAMLRTRTNVG